MKSIAFFNNKGGVGKTTLLCNIASFLSVKENKRVLIIDADPQCNASIYLMEENNYIAFYENDKNKTLYDIIRPLQKGKGYYTENLPIIRSENFHVDFIPGDTRLAIMEDFLSKDWIEAKSVEQRGFQTTFVIKDIIDKVKDNYDYILFDVGPSLGAINRIVLLACDFFIIPMSSDIFSIKAVENISQTLSLWVDDIKRSLTSEVNQNDPFLLNGHSPSVNLHFLGYVKQQYTPKTINGEKRPVKAYERILKKIPDVIKKRMYNFYTPYDIDNFELGEIPNYNSLIPLSQDASKPVFLLNAKDGVVGAHFAKVHEFESVLDSIKQKIYNNISLYDKLAE